MPASTHSSRRYQPGGVFWPGGSAPARRPSLKSTIKATLLLLLGVGLVVVLVWWELLLVVLLAVPVFLALAGLLVVFGLRSTTRFKRARRSCCVAVLALYVQACRSS